MTRFLHDLTAALVLLYALQLPTANAEADGSQILEGLHVTPEEVERLENGAIIAFSDEAYESTKRELSADAVVLVESDLTEVLNTLRANTTLIPTKVILGDADINSDQDFANVRYEESEFKEVERLFEARPGKKYNFSDSEYETLQNHLVPYRDSDRVAKTAAASDAIRALMLNRYHSYKTEGLEGIESYKRSSRKQVDVGRELRLSTETFEPFAKNFSEFYDVMANYPDGADCCEHYFRWLKVRIRKRPTFVLSHTMIQITDEFILLTERHYFVTSILNNVQITMSWLPYDEDTYMGLAMSASADILDSMMGRALRPLGRNKAIDLVTDVMQGVKSELQDDGDSTE